MNKKKYIGIDIGGTAVKIGSVDEDGTIHATETYAVNFDGYETPILQTVVKSCHNFLEKYRENASEYAGIGVSATVQWKIILVQSVVSRNIRLQNAN